MKRKILAAAVFLLGAASASAGWKTEFGAEDRVRAEYRSDFDFNDALRDDGWLIFQRLKLGGRATLDNYEAVVEAADLRVANVDIPKPAQDDDLDLHQANFTVKGLLGGPFSLKVGRQELKYGKGRLVGSAPWANRYTREDAALASYKAGSLAADAFYGNRILFDQNGWNEPNSHDALAGVYATFQKEKDGPLLDLYFFDNYDKDAPAALNRRTVGFRTSFPLGDGVTCEIEAPYQFGKASGKKIYAGAFHLDLSRELDLGWKPRVTAIYNYASGDKDRNDSVTNSFVPLYGTTHDAYGLMDFFRWQNMQEAAVNVALRPSKRLGVTAGTNFFWLAAVQDSWYDASGTKLRTKAAGAQAGPYVGQEVSLIGRYDLGGGLNAEGGCAHFFTGRYVKDTGAHDDADWAYLQLAMRI